MAMVKKGETKGERFWTVAELEIIDKEYSHRTALELQQLFFPYRSYHSIEKKVSRRAQEQQLEKEGRRWMRFNKQSKLKKMSDFDKGYMAGMIDGEGTIRLEKDKRGCLHPRVSVANTNQDTLRKLQEMTGIGGFYIRENRGTNWKAVWMWNVNGIVDTKALLIQLKDCFIVKKRQAELLLKFMEIYLSSPSYGEVTPEMREIDKEMRQLNRRGPLNFS